MHDLTPHLDSRRTAPEDGFTLLELLIVSSVLVVGLGGLAAVLTSSESSVDTVLRVSNDDRRFADVLHRLAFELRFAELETLVPSAPSDARSLQFTTAAGWDGAALIPGPTHSIDFSSGDVALDGVVIASGVEDLTFDLDGEILTVALTYDRYTSGGAGLATRRLATRVDL